MAAELSGIVTEVQDGDSVTLATRQHTYRIRLVDIDAPELDQRWGKESRFALRHMCLLKNASAETVGEDRYGRTLAHIKCVGIDANAEQVRRGWAWVFRRYVSKKSSLYELERQARDAKIGVWQDAEPVAPWAWRRSRKPVD